MNREERDYSLLDKRFTSYYENRERVEVVWKDGWELAYGHIGIRTGGKVTRFYVGRSTGWRPIYLMLLKRNSTGGMQISSEGVEHIRGLGEFR